MQFKRSVKIGQGLDQINITPLVDVVFLLLIFFMLSSSFVFQSGITVKLPKAVTSEVIKEENLIITITSENVLYINDKVSTMKTLRQELQKKENKERLILIKADRRASLGRIIDIWDLCRELGIERVNIATNQEK
ncbi:MAG: biopolymer transporter ExbD [Candidatus Omnitrophota bacterium]